MDLPMMSSPTRLSTLSMRPASTRSMFSAAAGTPASATGLDGSGAAWIVESPDGGTLVGGRVGTLTSVFDSGAFGEMVTGGAWIWLILTSLAIVGTRHFAAICPSEWALAKTNSTCLEAA